MTRVTGASGPIPSRSVSGLAKSPSLSQPVGRGAANTKSSDVLQVQRLLNRHRKLPLRPIAEDGLIGPETIGAIEEFQRRVLKFGTPDGRVDPNGPTWKALNSGGGSNAAAAAKKPDAKQAAAGDGSECFPFKRLPSYGWGSPPQAFGCNRKTKSGGVRAHAGCDLYFPSGTIIHAVKDGRVIQGPYEFYCQTYAIEVDHGDFVARYGEVQKGAFVRSGEQVTAGQPIAKVGHLVGIQVVSDMLHFEMYSKRASGPLTEYSASLSAKRNDGASYQRRRDLIDPTHMLNKWRSNLPA